MLFDAVDCLDDDRLGDWVEYFTSDAVYKIVSKENVQRGLPIPILLCEGREMIEDRVSVLREASVHNLHYDRHLLGSIRVDERDDGELALRANYAVFQTDLEGESRLFSTGRYDARVVLEGPEPKLREMIVTLDTYAINNLIATPI
jgi:anthranilate 1,2-dioxygenase small subunit